MNASIEEGPEGGLLRAEVVDDGRGFDARETLGGVGTSSMRERARKIGGELKIESEPDTGTTVRFEAPVERLKDREKGF